MLGLAKIIERIQIWPSHLPALLLSFAAHLLLVLFIDSQITVARKAEAGDTVPDQAMAIHLVASESNNLEQNLPPAPLENQPQKTAEPHTPPSAPSDPAPESPPPHFEILVPPAPYYFRSNALTVKPQVSMDIPQNLGDALKSDKAGAATFRLQINEQGEVDQVIVDDSSFSEQDERIVVSAFQKMKFKPGKIEDKAVKSELKIEVRSEKAGSAGLINTP